MGQRCVSSAKPGAIKVLIVEDEFLVALQLEDIVVGAGHSVLGIVADRASAGTVREAPQVALVDVNLRDGPSGPEIARQLSRLYGTAIIYVTANPDQIDQPAPTAIGVVQKPFSHTGILAALNYAANDGAEAVLPPELELCFK